MPHKILYFSHEAELAGAEMSMLRFIIALNRERFSPLVFVPRHGPLEELLTQHGIPTMYIPYFTTLSVEWTAPKILKQTATIRDAIWATAPELILINTSTIPQAIIAALTTDVPIAVHLHGFIDKKQYAPLPLTTRAAEEIWLQYPETLIACSDWIAECYRDLVGRDVTVIPNFVSLPTTQEMGHAEPPTIVMLASLEDNKRPAMFIEAAALIKRKYPLLDFRCVLYGDGPRDYVQGLQKQIERQHLEAVFSIRPRTTNTTDIYRECAIVFIPSEVEAFSMVAIEAAHQRPVVATRSGGPTQIIIDGETGFLIDVGDVRAAADKLAYLLQNPEVARNMGNAARTHITAHYTPQTVIPRYEQILEDTILNAPLNAVPRRIAKPLARYFMNLGRDSQ